VSTIFISYRRDDSAPYAGRLYDRLSAHFGKGQVFMDIDQIAPGEDFVEVINRKVGACSIVIVLIGKHWLDAADAQRKRRLDDPEDFVRLEVAAALQRNVRVVPVLVGGAAMPRMQQLPEPLAVLSRRNAFEISDTRFHTDVDKLIEALERPADESGSAARPALRFAASTKTVAIVGLVLGVAVVLVLVLQTGRTAAPADGVANAPVLPKAPAATRRNDESRGAATTSTDERPGGFMGLDPMPESTKKTPKYLRLANQGSAEGQYRLAVMYECGEEKDLPQAIRWYEAAAAQGHAAARSALAALRMPVPADARGKEFASIKQNMDCVSRMQEIFKDESEKDDERAKKAIERIKPG